VVRPHPRLRHVPLRVRGGATLLVAVVAMGLTPSMATAATPTYTTGDCSVAFDPQTCERTQYLSDRIDNQSDQLDLAWQGIWALVGLTFVLLLAPVWNKAWGMAGKL
jgi:hypothetical protein